MNNHENLDVDKYEHYIVKFFKYFGDEGKNVKYEVAGDPNRLGKTKGQFTFSFGLDVEVQMKGPLYAQMLSFFKQTFDLVITCF